MNMSTAAVSSDIPIFMPTPRLLTAADLAAMPNDLPSGPVKYELDDGRLIVMSLPGGIHGASNANIVFQLKLLGDQRGHGKTLAETGIILRRGPDRIVGPDSCFAVNSALPLTYSREGLHTSVPALIVEVRTKNDTILDLERKAGEYLAAGARLVWVIDTIRSVVVVFLAAQAPKTLNVADDMTAEEIIPGFRVKVGEVLRA